jgi:hypothetical protein
MEGEREGGRESSLTERKKRVERTDMTGVMFGRTAWMMCPPNPLVLVVSLDT